VSNPEVRNSVCSDQFIQRVPVWKINILLYEMVAVKTEWGGSREEGERSREWIKVVRDEAWERTKNGVG
jgi:hypothetical protein